MRTAIVYYSKHHGNTKKLLDALAEGKAMDLIDVTNVHKQDLSEYDVIGFASGIYYGRFQSGVLKFAEDNLPHGKKVFFIYTCGAKRKSYTDAVRKIAEAKNAEILGEYACPGWDTFGPFQFIGGIAKGHPDEKDIREGIAFFENIFSVWQD